MNIINEKLEKEIEKTIVHNIINNRYNNTAKQIEVAIQKLYANIPEKKRISYGRTYVIKTLSEYIYNCLINTDTSVIEVANVLFEKCNNGVSKGVIIGILSFYGLNDIKPTLPFFELSASDSDWNLREFSQIFFRKLINKFPDESRVFLLELVRSENPNLRRFVGETLRPVKENHWLFQKPDYSLSILKHLYEEKDPYPRTSVGNNLSDLAKKRPDLILDIVNDLVNKGDKNAYWIAYRACRNLVKKEPLKVMDILRVSEYKYKKRIHKKSN